MLDGCKVFFGSIGAPFYNMSPVVMFSVTKPDYGCCDAGNKSRDCREKKNSYGEALERCGRKTEGRLKAGRAQGNGEADYKAKEKSEGRRPSS